MIGFIVLYLVITKKKKWKTENKTHSRSVDFFIQKKEDKTNVYCDARTTYLHYNTFDTVKKNIYLNFHRHYVARVNKTK